MKHSRHLTLASLIYCRQSHSQAISQTYVRRWQCVDHELKNNTFFEVFGDIRQPPKEIPIQTCDYDIAGYQALFILYWIAFRATAKTYPVCGEPIRHETEQSVYTWFTPQSLLCDLLNIDVGRFTIWPITIKYFRSDFELRSHWNWNGTKSYSIQDVPLLRSEHAQNLRAGVL